MAILTPTLCSDAVTGQGMTVCALVSPKIHAVYTVADLPLHSHSHFLNNGCRQRQTKAASHFLANNNISVLVLVCFTLREKTQSHNDDHLSMISLLPCVQKIQILPQTNFHTCTAIWPCCHPHLHLYLQHTTNIGAINNPLWDHLWSKDNQTAED